MLSGLSKLLKNEDGATAIEYGLIAALIAVAAIAAFNAVGSSLTATFNNVSSKL
jgi:pilus assembly protein Flp/PilA